jgi:hypothetical protein
MPKMHSTHREREREERGLPSQARVGRGAIDRVKPSGNQRLNVCFVVSFVLCAHAVPTCVRIRETDLCNATMPRLLEIAKVVMRASVEATVDAFNQTSSVGLRSPTTPTKSKEEVAELEGARLAAYDMRHTFDFLGLTHNDLQVAAGLQQMVPDAEGTYSVVAVLKHLRAEHKALVAKSLSLKASKRKSGRGNVRTGL